MTETERHEELMKFMTSFRTSMEKSIKDTNDKLDDKLKIKNTRIDDVNNKIDNNEGDSATILQCMDRRLLLLEKEMRMTALRKEGREEDSTRMEDKNHKNCVDEDKNRKNCDAKSVEKSAEKAEHVEKHRRKKIYE